MVDGISNTPAALTALRAQIRANAGIDEDQGPRATASASDIGAVAIDQDSSGDLRALQAVQQGLANDRGLARVTIAAAEEIAGLLAAARDSSDASTGQTDDLAGRIEQAIADAGFNGINLLRRGAADHAVIADTDGSRLPLTAHDFESEVIDRLAEGIDDAIDRVQAALDRLRTEAAALGIQAGFLDAIEDATAGGLGGIVDPGLARDATLSAAGQVREQLALSGLSIANSQPAVLAGLFADLG
ncbi:MAG: hypothetical protein QF926_12705 [Alphaproteobacteria bacterium]|jgi:hypothetical protein|nr:hypothetical protein [Alphaproteobacteria bacterium]MDP6517463.1 hypothetical protein [Alphaproteobacteria bacterium]